MFIISIAPLVLLSLLIVLMMYLVFFKGIPGCACTASLSRDAPVKEKEEYTLYNSDAWKGYRLGDVLRVFTNGDMSRSDYKALVNETRKTFPDSFGAIYSQRATRPYDYDVMYDLFTKEPFRKYMSPPETCALHLRVGDALNNHAYSYPLSYYTSCIVPLLRQHTIHNIVIVTGSHTKKNLEASKEYIDRVKDIVSKVVKNVTVRAGQSPDSDFVFMATARYFVPSGGGFSKVVSNIVGRRKGTVLMCA